MKRISIIITILLSFNIYATTSLTYDSLEIREYKKKLSLFNKNEHDSLIKYYIKLIYNVNNNWREYVKINNSLSISYQEKLEFDKAKKALNENISLIREKLIDSTFYDIGTTYNILGSIAFHEGRYEKAIRLSEKSISIYKKSDSLTKRHLAILYINLGVFYNKKKNYKKALVYYNYGLDIFLNESPINKDYIQSSYGNIGRLYKNKKDYDKAILYYKKAMMTLNTKNEQYYISKTNLAVAYQNKKIYKKSLKTLYSVLDEYKTNKRKDRIYKHLGTTYYYMKDYEKALSYLNQSLELKKIRYKKKHPYLAKNNTAIADVYVALEDYDTALKFYQQSIVDLCLNFNDSIGISNPSLELISDKSELLIALRKKAATLAKMDHTEAALETYLLSIDLNESIGYQHSDLESRNFQYQETRAIYEKAMELAYQLYQQTKQNTYLETAFQIAERSKSSLLVQSLQDTEAHLIGGVPLALIEKEKELTIEISFYENKLFKIKNEADKSKMEQALFHKREDLDKLIRQLEKDYPKYYEEKYSRNDLSIADVSKQQGENEIFIEYFYGTDACYIISIDNSEAHIIKQNNTPDFESDIAVVLSSMNSNYRFENGEENYKNYTEAAYNLYKYLLEPIETNIKGKQLSISPDGILSYIPFEALLSKEANQLSADYKKAAYLIKSHSIHYAFSAGLNYKENKQQQDYNIPFAGYAPSYKNDSLQQLQWNREEVKNAAEIFNGTAFTGDLANKDHFMNHKNESQILHLAMHANADSINPMHSRLLFGGQNDKQSLYAYELCNMDIASELVVLSACETGAGQLVNGEGVMSLARSFFYAGCPSVIMSQWQLDDRTSTEIMQAFYQYLDDGKNKSEALRLAKLEFIEKSGPIKSNPIYWASIVAVGNPRPISNTSSANWYFGFLLIIPFGIYYLNKKKQQHAA